MRIRAVVLAAGYGVRLRPLTDRLPKPLLPVAGVPAAGHTLARLAAAGCEAAALNLHHLGDRVRERFGAEYAGMPLTYSEEPEILGTLGALHPLREFLAPADLVVVVNGDSLCRWPIKGLLRRHRASGAAATLMLARRADPAEFGGGVGVDREKRIRSFRVKAPAGGTKNTTAGGSGGGSARSGEPVARGEELRRWVFAGAQVFSPELVAALGPGYAETVRDLYEPLLAAGRPIAAYPSRRRWHDLGTPKRYLAAVLDWSRGGWPERIWRRSWRSPEATVDRGARLRRVAIESGAHVEPGARVEDSAILPGAWVGAGAQVRGVVVGPEATVPAGTWVERRLVSAARDGATLDPGDSRVGGLVLTPLERAG